MCASCGCLFSTVPWEKNNTLTDRSLLKVQNYISLWQKILHDASSITPVSSYPTAINQRTFMILNSAWTHRAKISSTESSRLSLAVFSLTALLVMLHAHLHLSNILPFFFCKLLFTSQWYACDLVKTTCSASWLKWTGWSDARSP